MVLPLVVFFHHLFPRLMKKVDFDSTTNDFIALFEVEDNQW